MVGQRSIHTSRQHQRLHLYLRQTLIFFSLVVLALMHRMGIEPLNLCYVTIASIISENTNNAKSE